MTDRTILDMFSHAAQMPRDEHFVHYVPGARRGYATAAFVHRTAALAEALGGLGVGRGDRVLLASENRPEWHMVDLAVLDLGAVDVPVYPTLTRAQIAYQARDSGAMVAVVENAEIAARMLAARVECPALAYVIQIDGPALAAAGTLDDLIASGDRDGVEERFWERARSLGPDDLATIVYTSGTTGDPKGVMLTHGNFVSNVTGIGPRVPTAQDDTVLEFLPLCHVFERCAGYSYMANGATQAYCSIANVKEAMAAARPTFFCCVPRVYEKVHATISATVQAASPLRRKIFHWAVGIGWEVARHRMAGTPVPGRLAARYRLADRLVLGKIRHALGGRLRASLSGAAPLPRHVNEFFHAVGMPIQEAYGLTETSPAVCANGLGPGENRLGSVGRPLDNLEIKVAPDGELLVRGPNVTKGYWNKPEHTAELFDADGFLRTGDIVSVDADGFVTITDRKKDIIVTAGGKNVAPQPIEGNLKQSRFVADALLIGDRQPFIVALLSPDVDALLGWAEERGVPHDDLPRLLERDDVRALFAAAVEATNANLARFEQIKRFRVLPRPLSVGGGHLTPTMKIKRSVVETEFAALVAEMYADHHEPVKV